MPRTNLLLALAIVVIGTVVYLAVDLNRRSRKEVVTRFNAYQTLLASQAAHELEAYLQGCGQELQRLAAQAAAPPRSKTQLQGHIQTYLQSAPRRRALGIYDERGALLFSAGGKLSHLNYARSDFSDWVRRAENEGQVFVSSWMRLGQTQADRLTTGKFFLVTPLWATASKPESGPASTGPRWTGVLLMTIDVEAVLTQHLARLTPDSKPPGMWIMDRDGTILLQSEHTETEMAGQNIRQANSQCYRCHVSFDYAEKMLIETQGVTEYEIKNQPQKLGAFARAQFGNASWTVVVNASYDEVTRLVRSGFREMFLMTALAVASLGLILVEMYRFRCLSHDITERKRVERYQGISGEILGILNEPRGLSDVLNRILAAIQRDMGFEAVGIRLRSGEDFPFFVQNGFSEDFLLAENSRMARDQNGEPGRQKNGPVGWECICGLILSGQIDPTNATRFTKHGSFWTNDVLALLKFPVDQDPGLSPVPFHPHKTCVREGYGSVAMIPIRANRDIVGLLQFHDPKKDRFTREMINFLEDISVRISAALIRQQQEDALRVSETRMRSITDSAQDAILMMDPEGRVSYWNPAAERILGYTSAEAIGRVLHSFLVPTRYHAAHQAAFPAFRETGQGSAVGQTLDLEAMRKDGQEISVQLSLSAIHINGGWHAVGLLRDITERKRAETHLRETNRQLQQATARANEMAVQATKADTAKSEFLANMSHEIRTPMNGVIGMTGLLLDTELNAEQRRYAETVRTSGESLLALLNDILDFSKIAAGKLDLESLDFDLRAVLDDFAATLALRAHDKGLEFICAAAPDVPVYLQGDPGRLRQILTNLAGNAVKFTHQGEIVVRVSLVSQTDAQAVLRFSIKDTGIGIPAEKQEFLFQKFTQADASTTRQYGGTGLGLAISKELAKRMGGEIGVRSEAGRGSEFWFTVCLGRQPAGSQKVSLPPVDIRGAHILVVDDNATNREVLLAQFMAWGLRAEETPDGPTALQLLQRARDAGDPFWAAILDMQMPRMDGAALAKAIKADTALKDTHLVLMTSLGQRGDAKRMGEIGFDGYLIKPARQSELFDCLSTVLSDTVVPQPVRSILAHHPIHELRRGGARVLLAEDNITNQQVALGILKKLGLRADAVANGAEAVKALETLPYDLVLMDVEMPEMDGLEATRQIRNSQSTISNHQIPIVAMTAHVMRGDRARCLEAGMDDYVTKPIDPRALAEALDRWLPQDPVTITAPTPEVPAETAAVSAPQPEPLVFDKAGMMARLMEDEDLAQVVIESLLKDTPKQIETLRGYLQAGDALGVWHQAHSIKGASANVGGEALRAVTSAMEQAGKAGDLDTVRASMAELDRQFHRLQEAIAASWP